MRKRYVYAIIAVMLLTMLAGCAEKRPKTAEEVISRCLEADRQPHRSVIVLDAAISVDGDDEPAFHLRSLVDAKIADGQSHGTISEQLVAWGVTHDAATPFYTTDKALFVKEDGGGWLRMGNKAVDLIDANLFAGADLEWSETPYVAPDKKDPSFLDAEDKSEGAYIVSMELDSLLDDAELRSFAIWLLGISDESASLQTDVLDGLGKGSLTVVCDAKTFELQKLFLDGISLNCQTDQGFVEADISVEVRSLSFGEIDSGDTLLPLTVRDAAIERATISADDIFDVLTLEELCGKRDAISSVNDLWDAISTLS